MNRRTFFKTTTAASLAAALPLKSRAQRHVGIQIGPVSFVDEGEDQVLDNVQSLARADHIIIPVFAYNRGLAGRGYLDGEGSFDAEVPDHGLLQYDPNWFHGGYYATPNMRYYQNTVFKDFRAPEFGDYDVLAAILPKANARGLAVTAMMADNFRGNLPNADKLFGKRLDGTTRAQVCFNNPEYRAFLFGLVEDCVRSYDIDQLLWRSEKEGPLTEALHLLYFPTPQLPGCFCEFCRVRGENEGIRFERAVAGYEELVKFTQKGWRGERPADGSYVAFWRILLRFPEILQWQKLFVDSLHDLYRGLYALVKSIKPQVQVGWGFSSQQIFNHLYRADADIRALDGLTDFLKFYVYFTVGGPRMARYIENAGKSIFADLPRDQIVSLVHALMGYDEGDFETLRRKGLSDNYVYRETRRALAGAEGTGITMWPAIDVNLPAYKFFEDFHDYVRSSPDMLKKAVHAVFRAGADRLLLARKYSEMKLSNLKAIGDALAEW